MFDFNNEIITKDITLYAKWIVNGVSVNFDTCGGNAIDGQTIKYGTSLGENLFTPKRTGYMFKGWFKEKEYINEVYNMTIITAAECTLYAQWEANSYTVIFDSNGGSGTMDKEPFKYDTEKPLYKNVYNIKGYHFVGWSSEDGKTVYVDEQKVKNLAETGEVVLTAIWEANSYTVKFDSNGGTGSMTNQSFTYNQSKTLDLNKYSKIGYKFDGWKTDSGVTYRDGASILNLTDVMGASVVLKAQWLAIDYSAQYATTDFYADIYCKEGKVGNAHFSVSGFKVKYDGKYYIYGNAYFSGVISGDRRNDVKEIYLNNATKKILIGGILHWSGTNDDDNENGVAAWKKTSDRAEYSITYRPEDPGKDFTANENVKISITDICVEIGGSASAEDAVPEIVKSSFTTKLYTRDGVWHNNNIKFDVVGVKVRYNNCYYVMGNAYYTGTPGGKDIWDVFDLRLQDSSVKILFGGTLCWSDYNNNDNSGIAGFNKNNGFDKTEIRYMVENPSKDMNFNKELVISISGICVYYGNADAYINTVPAIGETNFTCSLYAEGSFLGNLSFDVLGLIVKYNNDDYYYGNAFYSGTPGNKLDRVDEITLRNASKNHLFGGTLHWYGSQEENSESGIAGYDKDNSGATQIGYIVQDPEKHIHGDERIQISITGICIQA